MLQHKYNRRETIFVLLTEGNDLNFLSELPMLRIPARSTPAELKTFLNQPTRYYKSHTSPGELIQFTEREKKVIQLISNGEAIASIGRSLNLHIKTIYQIRLNLIKSLAAAAGPISLISAVAKHLSPGVKSICEHARRKQTETCLTCKAGFFIRYRGSEY